MGEVIRSSAAAEDIFADVRSSLANAIAKGDAAKAIAEERLGPIVITIDMIEGQLKQAREIATPLIAEVNAENDRADALLDRTYDDIWNDAGRPAFDRSLSLLFPGGAGYYTDGDVWEQPDRMELLAQLLELKLHPKLTQAKITEYAARVRDAAKALSDDLAAARMPAARVKLFERVRTALARNAQFELASLKRAYKNAGMSETEIHAVIPDRPVAKKKETKAAPPPAQPPQEPPAQPPQEPPS